MHVDKSDKFFEESTHSKKNDDIFKDFRKIILKIKKFAFTLRCQSNFHLIISINSKLFSMKKSLLLACLGVVSASAFATQTPETLNGVSFQGMSPNGRYLVSQTYLDLTIYDLVSGDVYTYTNDDYNYYTIGNGNAVSDNGIVIASTYEGGNPTYWQDGQWYQVEVPKEDKINFLNAVSADGSRIIGYVGLTDFGDEESGVMGAPAYWDVTEDGSYGECHILPYPTVDINGRAPQYVTSVSISDDGKTIVGQVVDNSGNTIQPITYTQNEDGEWEYKLLLSDLYTIDTDDAPENPGPSPLAPEPSDYMDADQKAEYEADLAEWQATYEGTYPEPTNYMTDEQVDEYNAAMETWREEMNAWNEVAWAYDDWYWGMLESIPVFEFNDVKVSPDGKRLIATSAITDYETWTSYYVPWIIDIESGEYLALDMGTNLSISSAVDGNTYFAYDDLNLPVSSYIVTLGEDMDVVPLEHYILEKAPDLEDWMADNLLHEYSDWDYDTNTEVTGEAIFTGATYASRDLSVIAFSCYPYWDMSSAGFGCVVRLNNESGVQNVAVAEGGKIAMDANGNLVLDSEIASVNVYDLSGRLVLSANANEAAGSNLANGIYIVRGVRNDGSIVSAKLTK